MIHIFKAGGDWKTEDGKGYTVVSVNSLEDADKGWFATLEEALKAKKEPRAKKNKAKIDEEPETGVDTNADTDEDEGDE